MKRLMFCPDCRKYTLKDACSCGARSTSPRPPKYSPQDLYAEYRRKAKRLASNP
ncbi:TPA: ribosome biogenesis protein [Candidatus Woesearchaeota archaeon]|nr:ribosome biogenesis protein [Candidatus Woesearchaeota archaeon]HII63902.1 ribosome biogenesis protein [Candidatus Woesearchaeota archaeon]